MKLIVLDRDGVINEDSDEYVKSLEEWIPIPGSLEAIARLCKAGWTVAVATNQSGVARGKFDLSTLGDMHFKMQQLVMEQGGRIDLIVHCPHGPDDGCNCRKPKPGMFRSIAEHFGLADLKGVP
ncbi:MAG: D-glycero-beta-D-manno-heptose 1,7-bisphosphate 7-phosphatase, partial [Gammaproteobacteria bacterium]|nr:D-glycero-beta-D-manno-heptose 1,7-bisphosphate 7-phosphatase [Gammaproteobacteria bacterium]